MNVMYIYKKDNLELIAQPVITTVEEFKESPEKFFPDWNAETMKYSAVLLTNPIVDKNGELKEMTKDELYKVGKYNLSENELIEDGKIKSVTLTEFEYIEDNEIKLNRDKKTEYILKQLTNLKVEFSEKEFTFKEKYLQKNRELDKNNLGNIVTMLLVSKQQHFKDWKFKDKNGNDVYVDLTIQEMLQMSDIMQKQTTKAMKIESGLIKKMEALSDEELKNFNSKKEFETLWNQN